MQLVWFALNYSGYVSLVSSLPLIRYEVIREPPTGHSATTPRCSQLVFCSRLSLLDWSWWMSTFFVSVMPSTPPSPSQAPYETCPHQKVSVRACIPRHAQCTRHLALCIAPVRPVQLRSGGFQTDGPMRVLLTACSRSALQSAC